jgi:RHS repeat-associated protein
MPTNVRTDNRDLVTQHSRATVMQGVDPVFLKSQGYPGVASHQNTSTTLNNAAGTVFDHGTKVAHSESYMGVGKHAPSVIVGRVTGMHNGDNGFLSWMKNVYIEQRNAVMHAVNSSVNAFWSLLPAPIQNMVQNGAAIAAGLKVDHLKKAGEDEAKALLDALMSTDTLIALAQTAALMGAAAIPVVGQLAAGAAAAQRIKSVIESTAGMAEEFTAMMNRWSQPMTPNQLEAEREKLASFLTKAGVAGVLAALGKALPKRSNGSTGNANSQEKVQNGTGPGGAKTKCPCESESPVIFATGEKALTETDFELPGPIPLQWVRRYRSGDLRLGWFGQGWNTSLSVELRLSAAGLTYHDPTGRQVPLPWLSPGDQHFDAYEQFTLVRRTEHEWRIVHKSRLTQVFLRTREDQFTLPLAQVTDANDNRVSLHYPTPPDDPFEPWRPDTLTDSAAREIHLRWDERGCLRGVLMRGHDTPEFWLARYAYTPEGELAEAIDPAGQRRRYEWRGNVLTAYTRRDGARFCAEYDVHAPHGRVLRSYAEADGTGLRFEYLDRLRATRITDELGRQTLYEYDERRDIVAITGPDGVRAETPFDANGHPRGKVDALGRETRYQFDQRGNLTSVVDAAGGQSRITYDAQDRAVELTDALGNKWRREYDECGNVTATIDPLGRSTCFVHDDRGLPVRVTDARGGVKRLEWDAQGLPASYADCSGRVTRFAHDPLGRMVERQDALGQVTRYAWDDAGRLLGVLEPGNSLHRYEWDGEGRLLRYVDPLDRATRYTYDSHGRPVQRIDAADRVLGYVYDAAGRLAELVNENGASLFFLYDLADNLTDEIGFDGRHQRYVYNAAGELTHVIETGGRDEGPGKVARFERDALGRLTAKRHAGEAVETRFSYDKLGRLTAADNDAARLRFAYDPVGQLLREQQTLTGLGAAEAPDRTLAHQYDVLGSRVATTLPDGRTLNWLFYGSGHLHQINIAEPGATGSHQVITDIERDGLHREVQRSQGALSSRYDFDPAGRLVRHRASTKDSRGQLRAVLERQYRYDQAGQLIGRGDSLRGEQQFSYDPTSRILAAQGGPNLLELFAFDPAGNLLESEGRGQIHDNRLNVYQDLRYEYDAHGNVTTRRKGAHEEARYTWDAEHRLAQATVTRHGVTQTTCYTYDALGRRVAKHDAFGSTSYLWDGDLMIHSARGERQALYLYEPYSFVPLATIQDGRTYWYQCDQIGAPLELTDEEGHIAWAADYKVWGEATLRTVARTGTDGGPAWRSAAALTRVDGRTPHSSSGPVEQPFRFQGQQFDEETGLHYNRFRYYDPRGGIYVAQDPIGLAGGTNFYRYGTNPIGFVDPWGLEPVAFKTVGNTLCIKNKFDQGSAASKELEEFTRRWNGQIKENGGTMQRRVLTEAEERDSRNWKKRKRCECPIGTVAGHVPDAAAGGPAIPRDWMAQMPQTNSYVGGIVSKLPVGYTYDTVKLVTDLGGC